MATDFAAIQARVIAGQLAPGDAETLMAEVEALRTALSYEARVVEAHYEGYKTFPKTRRGFAEMQVTRMREAASGHVGRAYAGESSLSMRQSAREAGLDL